MNPLRSLLFLALALAVGGRLSQAAEKHARPNIVFILADDQRADELGCTGNPIVKTPNIDRLARHGVLFENSFVTSASCMPNRTSLLTGQWERRHTIGWNSDSALSASQWSATFPMALKRQGYVVGYLGKNHTPGLRPADFATYYGSYLGHLGFYPKVRHPILRNADADTQIEILTEGALDFLEPNAAFRQRIPDDARRLLRARPRDRPFLLYVCLNVPHAAGTGSMKQEPSDDALYRTAYREQLNQMQPPPGYIAEADVRTPKIPRDVYSGNQISSYDYRKSVETLRERRVRICQTVEGIDRFVGQVAAGLEKLGLADNTIFIYSSDNGILHGEHGYGGKCLLYDPSIRVPLIIYDPRQPQPAGGRRVPELVVSADVAPTILELAGVSPVTGIQGRSL
ncbi:MAG: sulfatase-like hydrolase/transferase, partial [Opitutaceae bacterium]